MKGPGGRWKYDLRRVWECPRCGKRDFTTGQVVHRACPCAGALDPGWMRLVEEPRKMAASSSGPVQEMPIPEMPIEEIPSQDQPIGELPS